MMILSIAHLGFMLFVILVFVAAFAGLLCLAETRVGAIIIVCTVAVVMFFGISAKILGAI